MTAVVPPAPQIVPKTAWRDPEERLSLMEQNSRHALTNGRPMSVNFKAKPVPESLILLPKDYSLIQTVPTILGPDGRALR